MILSKLVRLDARIKVSVAVLCAVAGNATHRVADWLEKKGL